MKSLFLIILTFLSLSVIAEEDIKADFYINGEQKSHIMLMPNSLTTVEIAFTDIASGEAIKDFKIMHGKIMHMIILKSDLSTFKHVHPYFDPVTGRFFIMLNTKFQDPDNFDSMNIFDRPGMYMLMADVVVKGKGMRMVHQHVMITGEDQKIPLVEDEVNDDQSITKYFSKDDIADYYQATMRHEKTKGCGGSLVEFGLVLKKKTENGYEEIQTIEPWLGVGGHSVVVSKNFMKGPMGTFSMAMGHMHSPGIDLEGNPLTSDFMFSLFDNGKLLPGLHRIWIQVKDQDKVLKLPFTFDYQPVAMNEC